MNLELIASFSAVLRSVRSAAGERFSGAGMLVCSETEGLPIIALRRKSRPRHNLPDVDYLAKISTLNHVYHDGFHVLDPSMKILAVSQYFSPPIVEGLEFPRVAPVGGRYVAALFGSCIPAVLLAGTVTIGSGVTVFERGVLVFKGE